MVGHTHEDVDQMFSRISQHLTGKSIPTLPVLQELMKASYHPTPIVSHLEGAWDYRQLSLESRISMQGHSSPHVFRFKEVAGEVVMSYKEWPYKSAPYKDVVVTELAMGFERDPVPITHVSEKGSRVIMAMRGDLRKWRDGGKVTDEEVEWWKQHLEEEGQMSHPTQPLASSFNHHRIPTQDFVNPPSLDNLRQHVRNLTKESNVSLIFLGGGGGLIFFFFGYFFLVYFFFFVQSSIFV